MTPNALKYNSQREQLIIPEYGRNIQTMIVHLLTIEDREARTKAAHFVVSVMAQMHPQVKESSNYLQKLWDHMYMISDYKLDVDAPYEKPTPEEQKHKPEHIGYNKKNIKYGHYGEYIVEMIEKACQYDDDVQREAFAFSIANQMKRSYLNWNRDVVNDTLIIDELKNLSEGRLTLPEDTRLMSTYDLIGKTTDNQNNQKKKKQQQQKKTAQPQQRQTNNKKRLR